VTSKVVFPGVRKVFPQLITQQITSVQPMSISTSMSDWLFGSERGLVRSQDTLNLLFQISEKFNELFPVGSEVNLDIYNKIILTTTKGKAEKLIVKSESYVLANYSVVGFLCDKSDDDTHMFYVQDLIEYQLILKEIKNEVK